MNALEAALVARLAAASGLTSLLASATSIYNQQAPTAAALAYIVFAYQAGGPTNLSPIRAESLIYLVKGVTRTGAKAAGAIDDAIDAALHNAPLTVTGYTNYWLMREGRMRMVDPDTDGQPIYHAGGFYRVRLGA